MALDSSAFREAALERAHESFVMYEAGHFAATHYLAGLAVECMLYACRIAAGGQLDLRHNLSRLWQEAKFADYLGKDLALQAGECLSTVVVRWLNNHRYRSDAELRQWLVSTGIARAQGSRDDPLKHSAKLIANAALAFVPIGDQTWRQLQTRSDAS